MPSEEDADKSPLLAGQFHGGFTVAPCVAI